MQAGLISARPKPLKYAILTVMIASPLKTARVRSGALYNKVYKFIRLKLYPAAE